MKWILSLGGAGLKSLGEVILGMLLIFLGEIAFFVGVVGIIWLVSKN